jgi:dihydrofolate reductase
MQRLSIIAAMAENRVIGVNNTLPWRLPADLKNFREVTTGHHVIMGRRTYESLGKPLPNRRNVVITANAHYSAPGCVTAASLDAALRIAGSDPEVFIIGGASCYTQALPRADRLYLTLIHAQIPGDARFPPIEWGQWNEVSRVRHEADEKNPYPFSFLTLDKMPDKASEKVETGGITA